MYHSVPVPGRTCIIYVVCVHTLMITRKLHQVASDKNNYLDGFTILVRMILPEVVTTVGNEKENVSSLLTISRALRYELHRCRSNLYHMINPG